MAARLKRVRPAAALALLAIVIGAPAWGQDTTGKRAWTHARVSAGLHSLEQAARVAYPPAPSTVPPGSVITQVHANRDYAGQADVHTSLCWNGIERCVDITGRSLNTRDFNGLDATRPLYLVHRVTAWRGSRPPLYIKGNVTVWYASSTSARPAPGTNDGTRPDGAPR